MTTVFILSHPDDEAYGPGGTICRIAQEEDVVVVSLCKGNRPGSETVQSSRQEAFLKSCEILGARGLMFDSSDLHLDYHVALKDIESVIKEYQPSRVFTHNISDVHRDHRITAEAVLAACRTTTKSCVDQLYFCEIPASTYWSFGQIDPVFVPNFYVNITDYVVKKEQALELYATELHEFPDARSVESMEVLAKYRGSQVGYDYAESFKLIFSKQ